MFYLCDYLKYCNQDCVFRWIILNKKSKNDLIKMHNYPQQIIDFLDNNLIKNIVDIKFVPPNEKDIILILNEHPICVFLNASSPKFALYKSGIYTETSHNSLNYVMLLVGYGTDNQTGLDYWLLKNTWGKDWGEDGFIRIARNNNNKYLNVCGMINSLNFYPIIKVD